MKNIIIIVLVALVAIVGIYALSQRSTDTREEPNEEEVTENGNGEEVEEGENANKMETVLGTSVEDRDIKAFHFGKGDNEILFVGGISGGYSWNTSLVAYELMDYLTENPETIPATVKVTVIPTLNPDGLFKVTEKEGRFSSSDVNPSKSVQVAGRFNANEVDLNRNFDCNWQSEGVWQTRTVSGGTSAFSEPETKAIKAYIEKEKPDAVVAWYSAAGGVFASQCNGGVLAETQTLMNLYADASGYKAYQEFGAYELTGDMTNWLAKIKIPAISILLTNHEDVEWAKNVKGIEALFDHYRS